MKGLITVFAMLLLLMSGCAEYRTVEQNPGDQIPYDIEIGDKVLVVTRNDEAHEFKLTAISETGVAGDGIEIAYDDIALLKRSEIDAEETALSAATGIGLALAIALVTLMAVAAP